MAVIFKREVSGWQSNLLVIFSVCSRSVGCIYARMSRASELIMKNTRSLQASKFNRNIDQCSARETFHRTSFLGPVTFS